MNGKEMSFILNPSWFTSEHKHHLGSRYHTFHIALNLLLQLRGQKLIVETGCARIKDNWEGDGLSTVLFAQFAHSYDYKIITISICFIIVFIIFVN